MIEFRPTYLSFICSERCPQWLSVAGSFDSWQEVQQLTRFPLFQTPVSMTMMNVLHNPSVFPDPYTFKPERWVGEESEVERLDRFMVAFGKGNRMCIGMK